MKRTHTSRIIVDFRMLDENIRLLRRIVGVNVGLCGVVKADGYGLGAVPVASRLSGLGVDMLAVFTVEEARELVGAGIGSDILLFMPIRHMGRHDILYRALISGRLHSVVHDEDHLDQLIGIAESFGCVWPLHVEIDTGMSRGGMTPDEARGVINRIRHHRRLQLAGIMTHFACADCGEIATEEQFRGFADVIGEYDDEFLRSTKLHIANTSACLNYGKRFHFDMVRLGLAWVGYGGGGYEGLRPIMRWLSSIVHTKWIDAGTPVGYGWTWKAERRTRLGLVPVGYADGYPAVLSNRSVVRICRGGVEGEWWDVPVVGQVSMDQMMIDLTEVPVADAGVDSEVELLSGEVDAPNNLTAIAKLAGVVPYAVLCGLSSRIPRRYVNHREGGGVSCGNGKVAGYSDCATGGVSVVRTLAGIRTSK